MLIKIPYEKLFGENNQAIYYITTDREIFGVVNNTYELIILAKLSRIYNEILEIGTFLGTTAGTFILNNASVLTIDNYSEQDLYGIDYDKLSITQYFENLSYLVGDSTSKLIQEYLLNIFYRNKKPNFIFIDGGHNYETVKSDFYFAQELVEKNGIIVFHDYNLMWRDIVQFIEEISKEYKLYLLENTSLVVYREEDH